MSVAKQSTGDERGRYVRAAGRLRLPFWDWAKLPLETADSFPRVFTDQEVLVSTPTGRANITNPLKSYVFRPNEDHSFMNANETARRPNFAVSDILQMRADLWAAPSSGQPYSDFSTEARLDGANKGTKSLNLSNSEAIHDHVHVLVGGHMSVVSQAAFDPIFWLHHTNVDRILAIYQAAHPDEWVSQSVEAASSMWYTSGTVTDGNTSLQPFRPRAKSGFWTSNALRSTRALNYTYEGLGEENVTSVINGLHTGKISVAAPDQEIHGGLAKRTDEVHGPMLWLDNRQAAGPPIKLTKHFASIQLDAGALNGSFTIFLFGGDFNRTSPTEWRKSRSLMAFHGFFLSGSLFNFGFRLRAGVSIPDRSFPPDLQETSGRAQRRDFGTISDLARQRFDWRIVDADGCIKDASNLPGLDVSIIRSEVHFPCDDASLPVWEDFTVVETLTDRNEAECH